MIVCAHQPNLLPGCSVVTKIMASNAVIWVDEVNYSHYSWTARNRLSNGQQIVVPLRAGTRHGPINRVQLDPSSGWRRKLARTLTHHLGAVAEPYNQEILRPYGLLVGMNAAILHRLLADVGCDAAWHWQSQLLGGRKLGSIVDDRQETGKRRQISYQLAAMVQEVGGTVYLSGPTGFRYLDEEPFQQRGIEVRYWSHAGPNPCALEMLTVSCEQETQCG